MLKLKYFFVFLLLTFAVLVILQGFDIFGFSLPVSTKQTIENHVYIEESSFITATEKALKNTVLLADINNKILGSGFISNSKIITAKHVVFEINAKYIVYFNSGQKIEASIEKFDIEKDIAVLKLNILDTGKLNLDLTGFGYNSKNSFKLGQKIISVGSMGENSFSVLSGIVSGINRDIEANLLNGKEKIKLKNLIQLDANFMLGFSGAPVVNLNGDLIGMLVAVAGESGGVGFAVSATDMKAFEDAL